MHIWEEINKTLNGKKDFFRGEEDEGIEISFYLAWKGKFSLMKLIFLPFLSNSMDSLGIFFSEGLVCKNTRKLNNVFLLRVNFQMSSSLINEKNVLFTFFVRNIFLIIFLLFIHSGYYGSDFGWPFDKFWLGVVLPVNPSLWLY